MLLAQSLAHKVKQIPIQIQQFAAAVVAIFAATDTLTRPSAINSPYIAFKVVAKVKTDANASNNTVNIVRTPTVTATVAVPSKAFKT